MQFRGLSRVLAPLLAVVLAGCGLFEDDDRAPWRAQAEATCFARNMVKLSPLIQKASEVEGRGACGLDRPLKVSALADGTVRISGRALTMSCPVTAALETWVSQTIQPAAMQRFGMPVVELKSMGTYNCRTRNNAAGARLSEHAFANAIDISGFVLADGTSVSVLKGWRGNEAERAFLRLAHAGACGPFSTVLGPGSDGLHENHFHFDLARHNTKGTMRYCRPQPQTPAPASVPMIMVEAGPAPDGSNWPRVLPQSVAADAAAYPVAAGPLPPMPIGQAQPPIGAQGYPSMASDPAMAGSGTVIGPAGQPWPQAQQPWPQAQQPWPQAQQPYPQAQPYPQPVCPAGYICAPAPSIPAEPAALGWQVGPQPVVYDDVTGSTGEGGYSDE